ncbi:MAG: hypothetical protein Q9200_000584 [Gallowayella weberi]
MSSLIVMENHPEEILPDQLSYEMVEIPDGFPVISLEWQLELDEMDELTTSDSASTDSNHEADDIDPRFPLLK